MKRSKFAAIAAVFILWALCMVNPASAQVYRGRGNGIIDAGTNITVRTNESIRTSADDGRVYDGFVEQDVLDHNGNIAIPRGSNVELVVRRISRNGVALDLDSVMINGERYGIEGEDLVNSQNNSGIGANRRTGEYVGGGAILGAIIGAIAGGGKGAAIGAAGGAAAGAGVQVLTRGRNINVPPESLLTFRLEQPLRAGVYDNGYMWNGRHYHNNQAYNSSRYSNSGRYPYDQAYRQKPGYYGNGQGMVSIGRDNNITWQGPYTGYVYVQVDNQPLKLFASGVSGTQPAPWIQQGHVYTFILQDVNGNELGRDQVDLRSNRNYDRRYNR
jgi:hypothetical protein